MSGAGLPDEYCPSTRSYLDYDSAAIEPLLYGDLSRRNGLVLWSEL